MTTTAFSRFFFDALRGIDTFVLWPNFMILFWETGWYLTYTYWPLGPSKHLLESTLNFVPPESASQRAAQEFAFSTFKEYAFQDANTLEATQTMIESEVVEPSRSTIKKSSAATMMLR